MPWLLLPKVGSLQGLTTSSRERDLLERHMDLAARMEVRPIALLSALVFTKSVGG